MGPIVKVLLVDDHPVVLQGLRSMLAGEPGVEVVGEACNGEEAVRRTTELEPDVVLMDVRMPGMSGIEATRQIKQARPTTSVIVLTILDSEIYVVDAVKAGAAGYLTKSASRELLADALRTVRNGGTLLHGPLLRLTLQSLLHGPKEGTTGSDPSPLVNLTPRERDVLQFVAQGYPNKAIGAQLGLAEVTIKKYVQAIIGKLGVSDRTQAAVLAVRMGLV